jgi:hypothetical protein
MARSRQSSLNVVIVLLDRRKSRIPQLLGSLASARARTAAHSKLRLKNFGPQRVQTTMLGHSRDTSQSWVFRKVVPGQKSAWGKFAARRRNFKGCPKSPSASTLQVSESTRSENPRLRCPQTDDFGTATTRREACGGGGDRPAYTAAYPGSCG